MAWAPDYVTVDELAESMRIEDDLDDVYLAGVVTAASRAIDRTTNRQFGVVDSPEARFYKAEWGKADYRWRVAIDDTFDTPTAVAVDPGEDESFTGDVTTSFLLTPRNAPFLGQPWTHLDVLSSSAYQPEGYERLIRVTALWGWPEVPGTVKQATLIQANRLAKRRDAPYGIAGTLAQQNPIRLLPKVDPDVESMLRPYVRTWWVK